MATIVFLARIGVGLLMIAIALGGILFSEEMDEPPATVVKLAMAIPLLFGLYVLAAAS